KLGGGSAIQAELTAIRDGLSLVWVLGFRKVQAESDCLEAVEMMTCMEFQNHPHVVLGYEIKELFSRDWECTFKHIYREANKIADTLAVTSQLDDRGENGCLQLQVRSAKRWSMTRTEFCFIESSLQFTVFCCLSFPFHQKKNESNLKTSYPKMYKFLLNMTNHMFRYLVYNKSYSGPSIRVGSRARARASSRAYRVEHALAQAWLV
ncbi:hypothetical protein LINPERPRIM_LOCUS24822, partial [Linum perenne]